MRVDAITIFPTVFREFLGASLIGRAIAAGLLEVHVHDLRDFTDDPHRSVDDEPYGGGGGMVMKAEPWLHAVRAVCGDGPRPHRILLSPQGERLDDARVRSLAGEERLLLLCGRYEAIDERVRMLVVDSELSVGDYVLSGGEVPAIHPPADRRGDRGAGRAAVGRPCAHRRLAARAGAQGDAPQAAGPAGWRHARSRGCAEGAEQAIIRLLLLRDPRSAATGRRMRE